MLYTIPHTYKTVDFKELFSESGSARWEEVWRNTDVFGVYGNSVIPRWGERTHPELYAAGRFMDDDDLHRLVRWLQVREIGLSIEVGAVKKEWNLDAARAREWTEKILIRLNEHGCPHPSIRIDEPLYAGSTNGLKPEAVADLVAEDYIRPLQQARDGLEIGIVEPWPACTAGDIESYIRRMGELGVAPAFVHFDIQYPRVGKVGSVPELVSLLEAVSHLGIPIGIIASSSNFHEHPTTTASFCRNTVDFAVWMHGQFDRFCTHHVVQSWLPIPERCLPEDQEGTFMWLVREYGRQYVPTWDRAAVGPVV